jgi:hypothetical protein
VRKQKVTLIEQAGGGWLWAELDRKYQSAASAQRAVRRDARVLSKAYGAVIQLIEWHPNTRAGELAVKVLTEEQA